MPYTQILDDSIKSPTLILTADHPTLLFLPSFFYKIKNFFFLPWVKLYMIRDTYLHDPPPFNGPFFMTPPFSAVSKSCDPPSVSTPLPLLIQGRIQGEGAGGAPPPRDDPGFLIQLVFCKKKNYVVYWCCSPRKHPFLLALRRRGTSAKREEKRMFSQAIGVEVEQETSAPPPKKNLDPLL